MPYLSGVLTGILLTILVVFVVDHLNNDSQDIVNWNVLAGKVETVSEEVREEVHEATAPEPDTAPAAPPANTTPPATDTGAQ
ncbi:MAG: hypothetical protein R3D30_04225 [Hyphomicrobiales bacterium]